MRLKARRLTAQLATRLLEGFYDAHGPEQMMNSYGWKRPPTRLVDNEKFWGFYDADGPAGWGSYILNTRDAADDEAVLFVGVFPRAQRQGHHIYILQWLARHAEREGAEYCSMTVLKSNTAHYERTVAHSRVGRYGWYYAGDGWFPPPGHGYFVYPLTSVLKETARSAFGDAPSVPPSADGGAVPAAPSTGT